jgi:hypothetical protein
VTRKTLVRSVAGVLCLLATLGTLSACTPADKPLTALRNVDGRPTLLVLSCPDFELDSLSVYPDPAGTGAATEWEIDRAGGAVPESITLLEPPPGWTATQTTLTALDPAAGYSVSGFDDGADSTVPIHFTLADLTALAPDQVLIGKPASRREAVSEKEFREDAKDSC